MLEILGMFNHFMELGYNVEIVKHPEITVKLPGLHIRNPDVWMILDALTDLLLYEELTTVYVYGMTG